MTKKPDSVTHHEERHEKMKVAAGENQRLAAEAEEQRESSQVEREHAIREAENQELTQHAGLVQQGETREMLLDRVRKMRAETPKEEGNKSGFRTSELQKQFEVEQEEGRRVVAENEAGQEKNREIRRKQEEEELAKKNAPMTETVHHPNPSQDEVFPTSKPR